ncbi:hypothetical protein IE4872_PD00400 (plasmid) [Rhizobium gallicum]|uniref:Uncharacterized protein n=1 Tax=Rhizobium gallicum TaxID=56730 RepID=A0A1L5NSR0_9HYPH|nr:hypothetical protein IE4872_PD00400 [Rhizobium gallicum]
MHLWDCPDADERLLRCRSFRRLQARGGLSQRCARRAGKLSRNVSSRPDMHPYALGAGPKTDTPVQAIPWKGGQFARQPDRRV